MNAVAKQPETTSWPVKLYLASLVFAFVTMFMFTMTLSGVDLNIARTRVQAGVCLILLLRLLWAVDQKEQGRSWRVYVACMFLAAPIWIVVEPWVFALWRGTGL